MKKVLDRWKFEELLQRFWEECNDACRYEDDGDFRQPEPQGGCVESELAPSQDAGTARPERRQLELPLENTASKEAAEEWLAQQDVQVRKQRRRDKRELRSRRGARK